MDSKILIITGMHRSGTSIVTQWLHRCGLHIGDELVAAGIGNRDGHFEDVDFLAIHQQFLKIRKLPSSGFTNKSFTKLSPWEKQPFQSIIVNKCRQNDQWGWKEPRTCLFLDVYKELVPSAFYLVVVRDYNATVNSMLSREYATHLGKFKLKKGLSWLKWQLFKRKSKKTFFKKYARQYLEVCVHYYELILDHIFSLEPDKYLVVRYNDLLDHDENVFNYLKEEWQFDLGYFPFRNIFRKELLSEVENIDPYVGDKALLNRAKKIDHLIDQLLGS